MKTNKLPKSEEKQPEAPTQAQIESRPLAVFLTWQQVIDLSQTHAPDLADELESSAEVQS